MSRLARGGLIDRARPIAFRFDGRRLEGFAGDTLASALVANDVRLVGRSFKYHRLRGLLTAGPEEPNALVTLGQGARATPNSRATTAELFDGLDATSQNRWPSLSLDLASMNQLAAPLLVAGFYYKTFMWPAAFWERVYEPLIRRAAGLGRLSGLPDGDRYDLEHGFCDLLVVGSGPAGLAAALTATRAGLRVILAEQDFEAGGRLLAERLAVNERPGPEWTRAIVAELAAAPNARLLTRTTVFGVYDGREYGAVERLSDHLAEPPTHRPRQRLWKIVAKRAVLASGAIERPLLFAGNDRPGVMMASAASTYCSRFAAVPGRRAVVLTASDSGWAVAENLAAAGVEIAAVVEMRAAAPASAERLRAAGVEVLTGATVERVRGRRVRAVDVRDGSGRRRRIAADLVAMAGGWNPAIGLGGHLGARPVWSGSVNAFLLGDAPPGLAAAGAAAGRLSLGEALADGARAAGEAIAASGRAAPAAEPFRASDDPAGTAAPASATPYPKKTFVDFQHDVTAADVALAAREGFVSIEHMKRYTTLGMATDQGRTSQLNGHALLAAATGRSLAELGTIASRPPYQPVAIGLLAGRRRGAEFRPERRTAGHGWAEERGAVFTDAGDWKRAQYFPRAGERDWRETVDREVAATRNGVGICDVSTLGKIDVQGSDAGALLDRLYINTMSTLPVGKARYGLMLREDGFVMDDGAAIRLAEDRFLVTTTTANAASVMRHVDHSRQVLWPELDAQAVSATEQWSVYSVSGPRSRALVQAMFPALDLSNAAFPHLAAIETVWSGAVARIARLSFTGELGFEVGVPALLGERLARALLEAGRAFDAVAYGTEALGVMRIEKGHPGGGELDGRTTAGDLGLARLMSTKKDFVGRAMAARPGLIDPDRPVLVGLKPVDGSSPPRAGAHLLPRGAPAIAVNDQGHVTSAAFSPTLGHPIALALLARGRERHGERVVVHDPIRGGDVEAEVRDPVFFDPEGLRARG